MSINKRERTSNTQDWYSMKQLLWISCTETAGIVLLIFKKPAVDNDTKHIMKDVNLHLR